MPKYFDIGVNFTDPMFSGLYHGRQHHQLDLDHVIHRARRFNVSKMLVTGSSYTESLRSIEICKKYPNYLYSTVGVHPCCVNEFLSSEDQHLKQLKELALDGKKLGIVKAFGEIGLDYDRLQHASKENQKRFFQKQLEIAVDVDLPLFLHMRAACDDFLDIIKPFLPKLSHKHVVHSFTGTEDELQKILSLGFYVSVNGCSLKTKENLNIVLKIPLDRLMIETDAPWCEIRKSSAAYGLITGYPNTFYPQIEEVDKENVPNSHEFLPVRSLKKEKISTALLEVPEEEISNHAVVKSRNEPVYIGLVAEVMAKLLGVDGDVLVDTVYSTSMKVFNIE